MFVIRIGLLELSPLEMIHKRNTIRVMMCLVIGINLKHRLPGVEFLLMRCWMTPRDPGLFSNFKSSLLFSYIILT